uniref:Uncharacterized protein n=1 Tax=Anguilla anguilla TaxID=7936 RepID=A0A0E9V4T9_ANGAN
MSIAGRCIVKDYCCSNSGYRKIVWRQHA